MKRKINKRVSREDNMQKIYKYIRNGDSEQSIFYSTNRKGFDQEQKEDIGLLILMQQADRTKRVSREEVFKLLE